MTSPRIAIIGAGMSGLLSAINLGQASFDDVVVYEKADRLGGTWRENTYPGVACDVPSQLYSFSFALNPEWSHVFSPGGEILEYMQDVADRHGLEQRIHYGTEVTRLEFTDGRWQIETTRGTDVADVVIAATGVLHHPAYPDIEGRSTFAGPSFHSARWDHSVELAGARVGVIGTGSSAVQITGTLVDTVGEFHLFQRTPQWIMPAGNSPVEESDKERYRADTSAMQEVRQQVYDAFTGHFGNAIIDADSPEATMIHDTCVANLERSVKDPVLREKLRPDYRAACKRLVMSGNFYREIAKPNAHLVTEPISGIEPAGIRTADGALHELDVLVYATGFQVDRFLRPIKVIGRHGIDLDQQWDSHPVAYLSLSVPGFPNLFMLNGPNGPVGNFPLIEVAELQFAYIRQLIERIARGECTEVAPTASATERREAERVAAAKTTIWSTGCKSWYLDSDGVPAAWPWTFTRFREVMEQPDLADYELRS